MQIKYIKQLTQMQPNEKLRISNFTHADIDKFHMAICNQISRDNLMLKQRRSYWLRKEYSKNEIYIRRVK